MQRCHWELQKLLAIGFHTRARHAEFLPAGAMKTDGCNYHPQSHWTDQGIVVQSTHTDNCNTIDSTVSRHAGAGHPAPPLGGPRLAGSENASGKMNPPRIASKDL
jgi:hypothetical protein